MREQIIFLDGIDKSGKTSIKKELVKQSEGKYLVIDRAFISQIVYSRLYNRNINEIFFLAKMATYNSLGNTNFIFVFADYKDIKQRIIDCNEQDITIEDVEKHKKMFEEVIEEIELITPIRVIRINTSDKTISETVKEIIDRIDYI